MIKNNIFFNKLKHYNPKEKELIKKTYTFAQLHHKDQKRESGEEYFYHPVTVAMILINMNLDSKSICAALLHDVVEDTSVTLDIIEKEFDKEIAFLVDGVTKLTRIRFKSNIEKNAENFRKFIVAISGDTRILIIKLADKLHNMRTIKTKKSKDKRIRTSKETLYVFAPLAERIGMYQIKNELEDLAFEQTNPIERKTIIKNIQETKEEKEKTINYIKDKLVQEIQINKKVDCMIFGRQKKPYSIWKKMRKKNVSFEHLSDIYAFRIIVKDIPTCYETLGIINSKYKMIPDTFKDYISTPKENGYQSLHTIILGPKNIKTEIQIRTQKMHNIAEFGVASHWLYKQETKKGKKYVKEYKWLKELATVFKESGNIASTFRETKFQIHNDEVFCFTPKGDIFNLPKGSTIVDFAYAIHSDIGNKCIGGKINGSLVQLKTELTNGDEVEVVVAKNTHPFPSWLKFAKTMKAKSAIRQYLRTQKFKEYETLGRKIIQKYFEEFDLKLNDKIVENKLSEFQQNNIKEIYAFVGEGIISKQDFLKKIYPKFVKENKKTEVKERIKRKVEKKSKTTTKKRKAKEISIEGLIPGMAIKFAKCCFPIPGDKILGIINTGIGVTIHKTKCKNIKNIANREEKSLALKWSNNYGNSGEKYMSRLLVTLSNIPGSLAKIVNLLAEKNINISKVKTLNISKDIQEVEIEIEIQNTEQLSDILATARTLKRIHSIKRY